MSELATASLLDLAPVVPVVVLHDVAHAVPTARALVDGGVPVIELTLRTPVALAAMRAIALEVPEIVLGAGTVTNAETAAQAVAAGARFLVSPGATPELLHAVDALGVPLLPGAVTPSEVMTLVDHGYTELKFFPAEPSGGTAMLTALAGPFPQVRFCPTGGISAATAPRYLDLPNVGCVGGSWLTPADALASGDWARVRSLAAAASTVRGRFSPSEER